MTPALPEAQVSLPCAPTSACCSTTRLVLQQMAAESSRVWPGFSWVPWRLGRSLGCFERDGVESPKVNESGMIGRFRVSGRGRIAQICYNGEVQPSLSMLACLWPTGCHHLQVLQFCSSWEASDNCEQSLLLEIQNGTIVKFQLQMKKCSFMFSWGVPYSKSLLYDDEHQVYKKAPYGPIRCHMVSYRPMVSIC